MNTLIPSGAVPPPSTLRPGALALGGPRVRKSVRPAATVVAIDEGDDVELAVSYQGPADAVDPDTEHALVRQLGFTLQIGETRRVVYVTWRFEPETKLVVVVSEDDRSHEYKSLEPDFRAPLPPMLPDAAHVIGVSTYKSWLLVRVDRKVVWGGLLQGESAALRGPLAFRTENARFALSAPDKHERPTDRRDTLPVGPPSRMARRDDA